MLRVHWYFKKLFFNSLTIRIFYKSLNLVLLQAQWHSFFMFLSIGPINSHHQTGRFCQGLTHRVIWMLWSQQGTGILINRILCSCVASRTSVSGVLHSRSWRSKSHLSAQLKPQEAGIFKVLVRSFLSKANRLPLPFEQNEEKIFQWWSAGFQTWEDLQLQVKKNWCFHLMIPGWFIPS